MSCYAPSRVHLNHWQALIKYYIDCQSLCTSWASLVLLICPHENLSSEWVTADPLSSIWLLTLSYEIWCSEWVTMHLLDFIWIGDIPLWHSMQLVSCCVPYGLHLHCWHALMKLHLVCESLCTSYALLNYWHASIKFQPACQSSWAPFELLTSLVIFYLVCESLHLWALFELLTSPQNSHLDC